MPLWTEDAGPHRFIQKYAQSVPYMCVCVCAGLGWAVCVILTAGPRAEAGNCTDECLVIAGVREWDPAPS